MARGGLQTPFVPEARWRIVSNIQYTSNGRAGAVDREFCVYRGAPVRLRREPGATLGDPQGTLGRPWGDPGGSWGDPGAPCGLLWCAFLILLKMGRHFPAKCAKIIVNNSKMWLRGTLRTQRRKRNTAGGSDPGVYTRRGPG